jgi:hypothetical protein
MFVIGRPDSMAKDRSRKSAAMAALLRAGALGRAAVNRFIGVIAGQGRDAPFRDRGRRWRRRRAGGQHGQKRGKRQETAGQGHGGKARAGQLRLYFMKSVATAMRS